MTIYKIGNITGSHSWKCEPEESGRSNGKIFESRKKEAKR